MGFILRYRVIFELLTMFLAIIVFLVMSVVLSPTFKWMEGRFFPVVANFEIVSSETTNDGVFMYVNFDKVRDCDFIGINWYEGPDRLLLRFLEDEGQAPLSRPVGLQVAGPWLLGASTLEGTRATVLHKCHVLWSTETRMYP